MGHKPKTIDATVAQMQQILDRNYAHLEWRVLAGPAPDGAGSTEPWVFVHVRTRDFRYRHRVGRRWSVIRHSPTLALMVAELATEAEHGLAQLASA